MMICIGAIDGCGQATEYPFRNGDGASRFARGTPVSQSTCAHESLPGLLESFGYTGTERQHEDPKQVEVLFRFTENPQTAISF